MALAHMPDEFAKKDPPDGEWQHFMSCEEFIWALAKYSHCAGCLMITLEGYCDVWKQSKTVATKYANKYLPREHHFGVKPKHDDPHGPIDYQIYFLNLEAPIDK